jgi:hypothetical protein
LSPFDYDEDNKRHKPGKGLADACRAYGIAGWENIEKKQVAKDIGEGHWEKYGQEYVFNYCEEDVKKTTELLRKMVCGAHGFAPIPVELLIYWSEYSAKAVARIQNRGIPWDTELWFLVQEHKIAVIRELRRQFDPSFYNEKTREEDGPIYNEDNEWSDKRFENWLARPCNRPGFERPAVPAWPRLPRGRLSLDSDAFKLMYHVPGIEDLHALRDVIGFINKASLPISSDGRNRPSLFPFGTATGRNAHARSPYNTHAGMRSFIKFPPDRIGVYLDWRTQEVGILAGLSGCKALKAAYLTGDVYYHFARSFGFTDDPDRKHWKANNLKTREIMKRLVLAISYGMGVRSLAKGIDRHPLVASGILWKHRQLYARSWEYRDQRLELAMLERRITTQFGWTLWITHSPNKRTLYNFPMQGNGAEMLRISVLDLIAHDLTPSMLIHDGILFEFDNLEQIELAMEIMRKAGPTVCDFPIDVDIDQKLIGGARYRDKREVAQRMWDTVMRTLEAIGALPRRV